MPVTGGGVRVVGCIVILCKRIRSGLLPDDLRVGIIAGLSVRSGSRGPSRALCLEARS